MTVHLSHPRARQRWGVLFAIVALLWSFAGGAMLAVNQTGAFELEGNALTDNATAGPPDDWDRVCHEQAIEDGLSVAQATALCTASQGTNGATATTWTDAAASPTIFTGGGSKDPNDISSWLWKPKDTVPDKDTIRHAFAARYSLPKDAATCPAPAAATTCEVIFFGMDRFANEGDAQLGFWFFQDQVTTTNTASQGGFKFSGLHKNGDLLLISDFSNGGTVATISAYFWDNTCSKAVKDPGPGQCAAANLRLQAKADDAKCGVTPSNAPFCGIVNPNDGTTAPWPYTDKKGNDTYLQGEFFEGGINLSQLGIGDECFSSVMAESRASTSPTSVLKDFVLGQFAQCGATITTAPDVGSGAEVSPGTEVRDVAVVQGTGTSSPPTPTGNVTFFMCSFAAGTTDLCDGTTGKVGTQIGSPIALAGSAPPPGEATAISAAVNTLASPLAPGRYCFRAEWPGDTNYNPSPPATKFVHFGTGNQECFIVRKLPSDTTTTSNPTGGDVVPGTSVSDTATVTGSGPTPTGTVDFFLCQPSQVTADGCPTGGTKIGATKTLVSGTATSDATTNTTAIGKYCWRADYSGDNNYFASSHTNATTECFTTVKQPSSTATTSNPTGDTTPGVSVTDTATVSGGTGQPTPTGTVDFFLCQPSEVTADGCPTGGTKIGATKTLVSGAATSDATTNTNALGKYCWRAEYSGDGFYLGSSHTNATTECFTVKTTSSQTSAQNWLPNDSVTVTSAGGYALDGTLVITLREDSCTGTILYTEDGDPGTIGIQPITLSNTPSGTTFSTTNTLVKVTTASNKTFYWRAEFTSTNPLIASSTKCELTTMTINNNP